MFVIFYLLFENVGDLYRLWNPFKGSRAAWMYVSEDSTVAVVFAFSINYDHWSNTVPRLKLKGLIPHCEYLITEPIPNCTTQHADYAKILASPGKLHSDKYCMYK